MNQSVDRERHLAWWLAGTNVLEQTLGSVFHHIQHQIKTMPQAIIGIRHFVIVELLGKIHEQVNLRQLIRPGQTAQVIQIAPIHGEDQVEVIQILTSDLTSPQLRQIVATDGRSPLRPHIGCLTDVIAMRPSRIYFNSCTQTID